MHPHQQPSHFHSEQKHQENWFCSYLLVPIELAYAPLQLRSILADIVRRRTHHSLYYPSMSQSLNLRPHKIHRTVSTTPRIGKKLATQSSPAHRLGCPGYTNLKVVQCHDWNYMGGRSRVCGIGSRRRGYSWQGSPARPGESNVHSGIPRKNLGSAPIQDHPIRKLGPSGIGAPEGPTRYPKTGLARKY